MKKVLVSLFAITLTLGVFAQDSTSGTNKMVQQKHEGVIMKDGKLLMMKDGQTTQLTTDLTLDNGAVVMADGTVKAKDGTTSVLKEGDYVTMNGMTGNIKTKVQHKISKDSTMDKMKSDSAK